MQDSENDRSICVCPGCREPAIAGGIFCAFCEDHHYHTHRTSDGRPEITGSNVRTDHTINHQTTTSSFREYDTFRLVKAISNETIPVGSRGVVLIVLGGHPCQYEVEFVNEKGGNLGRAPTHTISAEQMSADEVGNVGR